MTAKRKEGEGERHQIQDFGDYSGNQAPMQIVMQRLLQTERTGGQTANDLVVALDQLPQCQQRPVGKTGGCSYLHSSKRQQLQQHFGQLQQRFGQFAWGAWDGREQWGVAVLWTEM